MTLKKYYSVMAFFAVPLSVKLIGAVIAGLIINGKVKKYFWMMIFFSALIIALKTLYVVDIMGFIWALKPFLFVCGVSVGAYFIGAKDVEVPKIINIAAATCLLIMLIQFYFFDIWSGSGDYRGRPTAGLRGFGEYALLAFFFVRTKFGLICALLVLLFSGSKQILLGIILGLVFTLYYRLKRKKINLIPLLFISSFVLMLFLRNADSVLDAVSVFSSFSNSVIECGIDCNSYTNRLAGSNRLFQSIYDNPLRLLFGLEKADVFHVSPEIGILFILKVGGIFLVLTIYGLLFASLSGLKGRNLLLLMPIIDPYCLSPISFFFIGFISSFKYRLNQSWF